MNNLQIFTNPEFGEVRTVTINGEPWLVGKDVAEALGYEKPTDAVRKHVDVEDRGLSKMETPSGAQDMTIINESGLYSLVLSSKLPGAKKFRRWVTAEVLPAIRKNGGYISGQEDLTPEELMARALQVAERTLAERDARIKALTEDTQRMKPKEIFADAVSASHTTVLIGDLAKILKQNGYDTGQKRLFEQLRSEGFLIKSGNSRNLPTQRAMELGLFEVKETAITNPDGSVRVTKTTKVTGKGQQYFINRYLAKA